MPKAAPLTGISISSCGSQSTFGTTGFERHVEPLQDSSFVRNFQEAACRLFPFRVNAGGYRKAYFTM